MSCSELAIDMRGSSGSASNTYSWTWADATARNAQGVSAADLGKTGYQTDMGLEYELLAASPARWGVKADPAFYSPRVNYPERSLTTFVNAGVNMAVAAGTAVARVPATTTRSTMLDRVTIQSAAALASLAARRIVSGTALTIDRTLAWGWRVSMVFVIGTVSASSRMFVGVSSTTAAADVDPNTFLHAIGVGRSNGEANLQLYRNGSAGTATKSDLGASFPFTTNAGYRIDIYSLDCTTWAWQITAMDTGVQISGSSNDSKTPGTGGGSVVINPQFWASSNADAVAIQVDAGDVTTQLRVV